jgi:hypothetical protein
MTKKIKKITKGTCAALREELNAELVEFGKRFGLTVKAGTAKYDDHTVTFGLELSVAGVDLDRMEFNEVCHMFGLTPDDWGKELNWGGSLFWLKGLKSNRPKWPVLASDGSTTFKLPAKALDQIKAVNQEERDLALGKHFAEGSDRPDVTVVDFKPRKPGAKGATAR